MAQQMSVLGIAIAKLVFHVVGMDDTGAVVLRKRIARSALLTFIAREFQPSSDAECLPPVILPPRTGMPMSEREESAAGLSPMPE